MIDQLEIANRLAKCFSSVVHDVMMEKGYRNFTLPPDIKPTKEKYRIAGQIYTVEGKSDPNFDRHETIFEWTGFLSKAPSNKIIICQPNDNNVAFMGELSAETLQGKNVLGYIADGGCRDLDFIMKIDFPVWSKYYTPTDIVGYWKPTKFEDRIIIGNVKINNNDYVMADIDGVVIIPIDGIEEILLESEKLVNTESAIRKAIRVGMDPQEAYLKYGVF